MTTRPAHRAPLRSWVTAVLSITLLGCIVSGVVAQDIPEYLLNEALVEGFKTGQINRAYESIIGIQLRSGLSDLDSPSNQLFNFRKPLAQSKADSVCLASSLLEVSKLLVRRLPGTTVDAVRRLQQQKLKSEVCQRLLRESGDDCANMRVSNVPVCDSRDPYRSFDGSCNNLLNPKWGAANVAFSRYVRPFYEDGLDEPRGSGRPASTALPSPRRVSVVMSDGISRRRKPELQISSLVMQFGQFLDHDLTHTPESAIRGEGNSVVPFGCCERGIPPSPIDEQRVPDCRPIDLTGDAVFSRLGRRCMRFVRSLVADQGCRLGPREQLNQVTSFLDGSVLYGNTRFLSGHLRDPNGRGTLRHTQPPGSNPGQGTSCPRMFCNAALLPEQRCHALTSQQCFISGDGRANEQPGLTSLHILFMRVHNAVALELGRINPRWSSETIYQEARRILVALFQQVVYREFLPVLLGSGPMDHFNLWLETDGYFLGYNESVNPTTPNVFATAAFRFGHSLVDDVLMQTSFSNVSLLSSFNQPGMLKQPGSRPSQVLEWITKASQQDSDETMVPTLTNNLFGTPQFPVGFDLYAINIMRGRDHGLAGYNEWRAACGLPRLNTFQSLTTVMSSQAAHRLSTLYRTVDDVDLFPGALAEHPLGNGVLGPTFACLIGQHFHDIKFGDRYWHENIRQPKPFSIAQLRELRKIWFVSLVCHHTNVAVMQPSPFIAADNIRNPLRSCPTYRRLDLSAWREGSPASFPPPVVEHEPSTASRVPFDTHSSDKPILTPEHQSTPVSQPQPSPPMHHHTTTPGRPPLPSQTPFISSTRPPTRPSPSRPIITSSSQRPLQSTWPHGSLSPVESKVPESTKPTSHHPETFFPSSPVTSQRPPPPSPSRPSYGGSTQRPPTTTSNPFIPQRPSYYPPPILPPFGIRCRAVGVWSKLPGMDAWCSNNCYHPGASHCPITHCRCS